MIIYEDVGNKLGQHVIKNNYWKSNGIEVQRIPVPAGDYVLHNDKIADVISRKAKRNVDLKKMDFVGTYNVSVDTKKDIGELVGNVCGKQHARFRDECILAMNNGIQLYILVENRDHVTSIEDLFHWHNPQLDVMKNSDEVIGFTRSGFPRYRKVKKYPKATTGERLAKSLITMEKKYECKFIFTTPEKSAGMILELLGADVVE